MVSLSNHEVGVEAADAITGPRRAATRCLRWPPDTSRRERLQCSSSKQKAALDVMLGRTTVTVVIMVCLAQALHAAVFCVHAKAMGHCAPAAVAQDFLHQQFPNFGPPPAVFVLDREFAWDVVFPTYPDVGGPFQATTVLVDKGTLVVIGSASGVRLTLPSVVPVCYPDDLK